MGVQGVNKFVVRYADLEEELRRQENFLLKHFLLFNGVTLKLTCFELTVFVGGLRKEK